MKIFKREKEEKIKMPLRTFLLYLVVLTLGLTGVSYSKYLTVSTDGSSARVAIIRDVLVTETSDVAEGEPMIIIPGVDLKKDVEVTFEGSEMQTCLFVAITTEGWETADNRVFQINDGKVIWSVDEKWSFLKTDGDEYVFYQIVKPNTTIEEQDIIQDGKVVVANTLTKAEMSSMEESSIKFEAVAVQYDSSKKDVMATWNVVR